MPEVAIIVPTFNERENIQPMVAALAAALHGIDYEVVFVDDDSPDATSAVVRTLAQSDPRVRILQRVGRRGLASAVTEGFLATSAPYLAVLDGDMQHDERILPAMLQKLRDEHLDIVVGPRNAEGGSMGEFSRGRVRLSAIGRRIASWVTGTSISDPMSGFFLLTRPFLESVIHQLSSVGFKILLDILASSHRPPRAGEVGYVFRTRRFGQSKLNILVGLEFLQLLLDKKLGRWIPVSYLIYSLVGGFGVLINLALTQAILKLGQDLRTALIVSTSMVIAVNFFGNNALTFRSYSLKGLRLLTGLLVFFLACSIGLVMNLFIAENLTNSGVHRLAASTVGIVFSSVWNYGVSSVFVWRVNRAAALRRTQQKQMMFSL